MKAQIVLLSLMVYGSTIHAAETQLTDTSHLDLRNAEAQAALYHGKQALKLTGKEIDAAHTIAVIRDRTFHNGTITLDVSGAPLKTAGESARGFIGIAFHVQSDASHYECIYIRPTNGRAEDQLRRNHSTQYTSFPDWPWERLRGETPGVYESYADIVPGEWTHLRIVVHGKDASLYVGNATQPTLLIHDLKLGDTQGSIALWIGPGTEGYFSNLSIVDEAGK
jgi:hypothetical protein